MDYIENYLETYIRVEKFGHEHYQEDINNYHQKGFDDEEKEEEEESLMDILDFIIDENRRLNGL